ncbi:MAG: beta-N-acetylhexosaminidase [Deltaproteobacteria bacterium]|nr:beta-N-acetylhexosaminidase [Deltaproteobacteria bacterium]
MDSRTIGNLFVIGFDGLSLDNELRDLLSDLNPSGVVLFSRNIEDPAQVARLNCDLQTFAQKELKQPGLFIGVDQEGGRVQRLVEPFSVFPSSLELASTDDPGASVRQFALTTARELRLAGFNLNFVPVLDVLARLDQVESSVIGDRSYGFDPGIVTVLGGIVIEAMRSCGVIPCCKHFPGHGGTRVDSHTDLPVDRRDLTTLERSDLIPFRDAVNRGVEMVMTAHVVYTALDRQRPGTLSTAVVEGLLRQQMGYDGAVITDDLDMAAVAIDYSAEERGMMALRAGVDLLLVCRQPLAALAARSRIMEAVQDGEIARGRIDKSLSRVRKLKTQYASSMRPCDERLVREHFGLHRA